MFKKLLIRSTLISSLFFIPASLYVEARRNGKMVVGRWERTSGKGVAFLNVRASGTINSLNEEGWANSYQYKQQGIWTFREQISWGNSSSSGQESGEADDSHTISWSKYMRVSWDGEELYLVGFESGYPEIQTYTRSKGTWE